MTKRELSELFGLKHISLTKAFHSASKINNAIKTKINTANGHVAVDYTLEECKFVMSNFLSFSPLAELILEENFIKRNTMYKPVNVRKFKLPQEVHTFIFMYKSKLAKKLKYKSCATCIYCIARRKRQASKTVLPYCNLYESFMTRTGYNVYKDRCLSWEWAERKPRLYLPSTLPQNLNADLEPIGLGKSLGIDNKNFTTGLSKDKVTILKEVETIKFDTRVYLVKKKPSRRK